MMTREHHRRRSPESERRRRKSRRDSRELLENQQMPVPAPYDIRNTETALTRTRKPSNSNSDSDLSLSPSSSSTTSSLLNISRDNKWGFGSFFSGTSAKQRQKKIRKKRSKKRFFRFGNSSTSSTNSDLAYGKGYIDRDRRRSRDFTPPGKHNNAHRDGLEGQRPLPSKREQTDEEILELGRKFAELARQQNNEDLRAAGRHRPSALVGAAAALSHFHRTNSGNRPDRGIGSSKPSHKSSEDEDSEWESASEDEEESSEDDFGLAYGSNVNLPTQPPPPVQMSNQSELNIPPELERPLHRKPSIVDPRLFGPVNSLRGIVQTPCGFDKVDRSSVEDTRGLPVAPIETVSFEGRPLQEVYPMPITEPSRYDAERGSIVSAIHESGRSRRDSRPEPVPIQQPKPIVPVSSRLYNTTEPDTRDYREPQRTSSGKGLAGAAVASMAGAALAGALASESKEDRDRKEERDRRREERREERRREERRVEDRVDQEREEKLREERRREELAELEREEKRREERRREDRAEQQREAERRSRQFDTNSRSEKAEKRRSKDDYKDDRSEKRREKKAPETDRDSNRERRRRERQRDDAPVFEREPEREHRDRPKDERRDQEGKPDSQDALRDEIREGKRASRSTDLDSYRRVEDPTYPSSGGPIDPFQFQVADDAFQTPKNATPNRPLTPNVVFVEREPDFSKLELTEADTRPRERLSRRDSYERELERAKEIYEETKRATAPIQASGMAAAMAAVEEERRGRNPRRGGDSTSRTRSRHDTPPRDAILEAADRYYRQQVIAQQTIQDHSREATPERSVVDKWQDEPEEPKIIEIVAPPEQDEKPKAKSPYEAPNADVRIDHVLSPKEVVQPDGRFRKPRLIRDPSAERGRPMLNLVRPTPEPSPMTQERKLEEEPRKVDTEVPQPSSRPAPDVVIRPRGDVIQAPAAPSKAVSWGENETKHYVLEDPVLDRAPDFSKKVVVPAETPKPRLSRRGKSGGWDIIAAAVAPTIASTISDSAIDVTEPEPKRSKGSPTRKQRAPFSFEDLGDEPPAIGPKPSGPRSKQMPGSFAEDLDFTATVAAGLQDSGFDPNLVIDNAGYHKRDSPPGSNEPGTYRVPFAETVPDLGIYAVPAVDPIASEQRGFVIGELPETPADEKDAPTGKSDLYSHPSKKERSSEDKTAKSNKYDRSEIVVIEDEPAKSSRSVGEDSSSSQSPVLSKKERKRRERAAKAKALEEEELASTVSLKESEPSRASITDELDDSPSKKKSKKSKKALVVQEEAIPTTRSEISRHIGLTDVAANIRDIQGRTSKAISMDDEWDVIQKEKRSRRGSDPPSRSAAAVREGGSQRIDERDVPNKSNNSKRDTIATDTPAWSEPASEVGQPLTRRRTMDEFSSFELTEKPEDWDLPKKSKKSKHESSRYDSPSRAPSVADDIVDSPKQMSSSFSDLRDLKGSSPNDEWGTPKKSKKKKSKRGSDVYDSPLGSPTMSRSTAPSEAPSESHKHLSKKESRASSLPRSAAPSEGPFESPSSPRHRSAGGSRANSLSRSEIADEKSERRKPKRRSTAIGIPDEDEALGEGEPPDRGRRKASPSKDKGKEKEKEKEKRSSATSGFFDRFKSSIGMPDDKERSRKSEEEKKHSFLDNAGTLGAGVGLAGTAGALASQMTGQKATDIPSEKEAHSIPFTPERRSTSPRGLDLVDPEIVQREIRPAIDPQYGDFLPLPPSAPGSPTPEVTELPALPDSRPETPDHERQHLREIMEKPTHVRRRSAHETPVKMKTPSHSAIPIQFRLGQRASPISPGARKQQSPIPSPETPTSDASITPRSRVPRPTSWDSSRQLKPLNLVMKTTRESSSSPDKPELVDWFHSPSSPQSASGPESPLLERSDRPKDKYPFTGLTALQAIKDATNTPLPPVTNDEIYTEPDNSPFTGLAALQAIKSAINTPVPPVTMDENTAESDKSPSTDPVACQLMTKAINTPLSPATEDELPAEPPQPPFTGFTALQAVKNAINTPLPPVTKDELNVESDNSPFTGFAALQTIRNAVSTPLPLLPRMSCMPTQTSHQSRLPRPPPQRKSPNCLFLQARGV
ncbi:involucrin repeat protein [Apiospora marii]|uniref:Involucrin repeat protein n=1 Tax=Apiospora marii TaxID=335849 RepID=A0ABR1SFB9_9PEZI